ncbi:MAG: hypothetical protein SCJ93_13540 [Bacillota bacterium]|nr:hypothetical protein [Bacillota bacterium]
MKELPKGLYIFNKDTDEKEKKRSIFWFWYFVICILATMWPIYIIANRIYPMILGMPFSMFWVAFWIGLLFVGTMTKFKQEY